MSYNQLFYVRSFIDLFNDNYQNIYDEAYDTIMENILMSDIIWNGRKVDEFHYLRKIDRQFSIALKVEMYLFQEVGKPELGFPNHEFIQLWARTSARRAQVLPIIVWTSGWENQFRFPNFREEAFSEISLITL